jgi:hypothetical protein
MNIKNDSYTELKALVSLLDEPNEENFSSIRTKVCAYGLKAIPFLDDACLNSKNVEYVNRVKSLVNEIFFNDTFKTLNTWSSEEGEGLDLLEAFFSISRLLDSDIDTAKYLTEFNQIRKDVWLELNNNLTALEIIRVLNHIIYDYHMFSGQRTPHSNKLKLYSPDHLFELKKGNSLSLGILYLAIAQNLKLPIYGVDLPGHFVLCYLDENANLKNTSDYSQKEVLFYLNAMNNGAVFTKNEIEDFVFQMNVKSEKSHFLPCSNKTIIKRLLREVSKEVKLSGDDKKSKLFLNLLEAVD